MRTAAVTESARSKLTRSMDAPSSDRDAVLAAVSAGKNTAREIADETGLNLSVVIREAEMLDHITTLPGPPCVTYWVKGKEPKGNLIRENGRIVERPMTGLLSDDEKAELMDSRNSDLLKSAEREHDASSYAAPVGDKYVDLPLEAVTIHPLNVRGAIDTTAKDFGEMVASIREIGIQEPLIVTPHDRSGVYRVAMGNRRRTAAEKAGLETVPCIIRHYPSPEAELIAMLVENIHRQGLKPTQEGKAFRNLWLAAAKDVHAVARQLGLTQSYISIRIRLLKLTPRLQEMVDRREISPTSGSMISTLTHVQQDKITPRRLAGLKLAQIQELVTTMKETGKAVRPRKSYISKRPELDRVTKDEENFTRNDAIRSIASLGETWFNAEHIRASFDDICLDTCHASRDETYCYTCPVPRFITSIVRRVRRSDGDKG